MEDYVNMSLNDLTKDFKDINMIIESDKIDMENRELYFINVMEDDIDIKNIKTRTIKVCTSCDKALEELKKIYMEDMPFTDLNYIEGDEYETYKNEQQKYFRNSRYIFRNKKELYDYFITEQRSFEIKKYDYYSISKLKF